MKIIDGILLAAALAIAVLEFGAFPMLSNPTGFASISFVLLVALTGPLHYGLMHETMHGSLFRDPVWDRRVGRLLGVTFGLSWEVMRFGHLAHHSFNRHKFDRPESCEPEDSYVRAATIYYGKLLVGHALIYVLCPILLLPPAWTTAYVLRFLDGTRESSQLRTAALRRFSNPARRAAIRFDLLAVALLIGIGVWCWAAQWYVFAACLFARWSIMSLLDNAPHYGLPLASGLEARNTFLPRGLSWMVMHQNLHGVHHGSPNLHWTELPALFRSRFGSYDGSWATAIVRQFRGPVALE